jgi:hypothetical protein
MRRWSRELCVNGKCTLGGGAKKQEERRQKKAERKETKGRK